VAGLVIAAVIVIVLAPLASPDPDGLERIAEDYGFLGQAIQAFYSILPDYTIPGIDGNLSTILAGLIGVAIVFGIMVLVGRALARRDRTA
jgi:cobalt/nickel transport system permease protein